MGTERPNSTSDSYEQGVVGLRYYAIRSGKRLDDGEYYWFWGVVTDLAVAKSSTESVGTGTNLKAEYFAYRTLEEARNHIGVPVDVWCPCGVELDNNMAVITKKRN